MRFSFDVPDEQRLDKFLVEQLPDFSRSRLQSLIRDGMVLVDDQPTIKTGFGLNAGMKVIIEIPPPEPSKLTPESIALDIVYEDDNVVVVDKSAGMVVHPSAGHSSGTLIHAVLAHAPEIEGVGGVQRPGMVHRLDKNTSGVIILAKNDPSHQWLQDQFRLRQVKKAYLLLVDGQPPTAKGRVEAPIDRDPSRRKQMAVVPIGKGRNATTEYYTLKNFPNHTYIEAHPLTGRTHQIRVHMAFLKCPIVGDTLYGHKHSSYPIQRHFLHATRLDITLPGQDQVHRFEAPLPDDLQKIIDDLDRVEVSPPSGDPAWNKDS
jgi:23S rRNA pseudouridine1911/1915/1917 synthase